ncbi:hypothetical protein [Sphingobium chungbukense]|uniref:Lipoprotein n=1 Tax=Sphingobium chungbukense TaxID=56193 RepID=A0A0M3AVB1_9SPHN|nr:hypothetical protein [Sphingobium chungbukense]KKW93868.1 hypothetical protein YP76_04215 [Sphingobium chungbukense]
MRYLTATILPLALLGGCVSTAEVREKPIAFEGSSVRPVRDVADCVAAFMRQGRAGLVTTDPIDAGLSVALNVRGQFGNIVFTVADIIRQGESTHLTVRGVGGKSKNPEKDYAPYAQCLKAA